MPAEQRPQSLAALVAAQTRAGAASPLGADLRCLATAVYYEARSESLAGQLAVARVIVNRAKSGRFPGSYCGVITQPGQFSFVRGGTMPFVPADARQWPNAVAIAQIADQDGWASDAEGALFFHARHVSPAWGKRQLAAIDNHIFYR